MARLIHVALLNLVFAWVNAANLRLQAALAPSAGSNASSHSASHVTNVSSFDANAVTWSTLSTHSSKQDPAVPPPQMFVAVFTTRATPTQKRDAIRQLWLEVDGGMGHICARFAVCNAPVDAYHDALVNEHQRTGDLLFLPCEEGYAKGLLTRKVIAAMAAYRQAPITQDACLNRPLFMKVDDDTFVAGHRFREGLTPAANKFGELMYAGVDLPSQPPERNPTSHWYEPLEVWPQNNYPPAMYGGPGYILGRTMIQHIIDTKIAESYVLWNEDRAVGVWVNVLQQHGFKVNWIRVPGTNGFSWDHPVRSGPWSQYPYVLAHHLSEECISCLTQVDRKNDPASTVDHCFYLDDLHQQQEAQQKALEQAAQQAAMR